MPLFLSAKAPNQNIIAIDLSLSSTMRLGPGCMPYAGPGYTGMLSKRGKTVGASWATGAGWWGVLRMLWQGCFMWPLAFAELGMRYLRSNFFWNIGAPFEESLADSFQESQNVGVAQQLVGNFDGVSPSLHRFAWRWPGWRPGGRCWYQSGGVVHNLNRGRVVAGRWILGWYTP